MESISDDSLQGIGLTQSIKIGNIKQRLNPLSVITDCGATPKGVACNMGGKAPHDNETSNTIPSKSKIVFESNGVCLELKESLGSVGYNHLINIVIESIQSDLHDIINTEMETLMTTRLMDDNLLEERANSYADMKIMKRKEMILVKQEEDKYQRFISSFNDIDESDTINKTPISPKNRGATPRTPRSIKEIIDNHLGSYQSQKQKDNISDRNKNMIIDLKTDLKVRLGTMLRVEGRLEQRLEAHRRMKEEIFRILIIGSPGSGKTTYIHRIRYDDFLFDHHPTVGVNSCNLSINTTIGSIRFVCDELGSHQNKINQTFSFDQYNSSDNSSNLDYWKHTSCIQKSINTNHDNSLNNDKFTKDLAHHPCESKIINNKIRYDAVLIFGDLSTFNDITKEIFIKQIRDKLVFPSNVQHINHLPISIVFNKKDLCNKDFEEKSKNLLDLQLSLKKDLKLSQFELFTISTKPIRRRAQSVTSRFTNSKPSELNTDTDHRKPILWIIQNLLNYKVDLI